MKQISLIFFLVISFSSVAQVELQRGRGSGNLMGNNNRDIGQAPKTVVDNREKPPVEDYKIISIENDTTYVDTTLTIYKDYKYNYLRKDNFELLPFSNIGQAYTRLAWDFDEVDLLPDIGAREKHYSYYDVEDIFYYNVPTPLTELFFKTTLEQGQNVDAFFTTNLTPRLNFSIAYRGLRSLGNYQNIMASQGAFRFGLSYQSKNNRYHLKTHFVSQDTNNEENGGLTAVSNQQYQSKDEEFSDRSLFEVNFEDAENMLFTKRFYVKQHYKVVKGNDSTQNNQIRVGHTFNFTDKEYRYSQTNPFNGYGKSYKNSNLSDEVEYQRVSNLLYVQYFNNLLGDIAFQIKHSNYNYGYQRKLILDQGTINNRIRGDVVSVGGRYHKKIGGFDLTGDLMINLSDEFSGNYLKTKANYQLDTLNKIEASLVINSRAPNFNFLLFQSDYVNYNWQNDFDNIQKQDLQLKLTSRKWVNLTAHLTQINNFTYFASVDDPNGNTEESTQIKPFQYNDHVGYFKMKADRKFNFGKFNLANTIMYQNVFEGETVFRVPEFVTRNSLYFEDYWFDKALYLQTGFTYNYFTDFYANGYDPVLSETYVQEELELEGFHRLDYFFNAKISQARLFLKLENVIFLLDDNNNYVAPSQPYRDFVVRFGIVWDLFL
ncbi:putative porin [Mesonia sp. JHPTF-M18]|uniref:Porin n=1 Tax=Mesonia aestuariivivens TaxID=2796128 RepID=A0ABS6W585_9FLAO|nr:putative porin [Mesonia aestuariivivens]